MAHGIMCSICSGSNGHSSLPCGHIFCAECIESLENNARTRTGHVSCPWCRQRGAPRICTESSVVMAKNISLNNNAPIVSKASALRPTATQDAEIALLRQHLKIVQQQRDEAVQEANQLKVAQSSYLQSIEAERRESILKSQENERLNEKLCEMASSLQQTHEELNAHISYRTSAQEMINNISKDNAKLKREVTDLKAQLNALSTQNRKATQSPLVKVEPQDTSKAIYRFEQGYRIAQKNDFPWLGKSSATSSGIETTPSPPSSHIKEEPASVYVQFRQIARLPAARRDRVLKLVNTEITKPIILQQDGASSPLAPPAASATSSSAASVSVSTPAPAPVKKKSTLKSGNDILWRGYGRPQNTPVPECTSSDGYHLFSGKGTNQYATKYNCSICHFRCSESRRRYY